MNVLLLGRRGKVGTAIAPVLEAAGHVLVESSGEADAAVDFTRPDAVEENVRLCLEDGVPVVIGTTGFDEARVAALARTHELPVFFAPNFALGAVLMLRFAGEAAAHMATRPRSSSSTPTRSSTPRPGRRRRPRR